MLVVNNGVMKSGSVLLGQILMQTGEFVRDIGQFQNTRWNAVSVEKDRISEFLDGYNFRDSNVCLKRHNKFLGGDRASSHAVYISGSTSCSCPPRA